MAQAGGSGTANDAAAVADTGAISAEELAERQATDHQVLVDAVAKAEDKIDKIKAQLEGAKEGLANAKAALAEGE